MSRRFPVVGWGVTFAIVVAGCGGGSTGNNKPASTDGTTDGTADGSPNVATVDTGAAPAADAIIAAAEVAGTPGPDAAGLADSRDTAPPTDAGGVDAPADESPLKKDVGFPDVATTAAVDFLGGGAFDFGSVAVGKTVDHIFRINNSGSLAAINLSLAGLIVPFTFTGGSYPGVGGTCGVKLAAGDGCTVVVTFAPASTAAFMSPLTLAYDNGAGQRPGLKVDLSGTGTNLAFVSITDLPPAVYRAQGIPSDGPVYQFGEQGVGRVAPRTFFVTNTGGGVARTLAGSAPAAPFGFAGGSYPGAGGTCGATLNAGATCSVLVEFTPNAVGDFVASFAVTYNDGAATQTATRALAGSGVTGPLLTIYDFEGGSRFGDVFSFGTTGVGVAQEHRFELTNSGGAAATGLMPQPIGAGFQYGSGGNCGDTLVPGASCRFSVVFKPVVAGRVTGTVAIKYGPLVAARLVDGIGTTQALLVIQDRPGSADLPTVFDFGTHAVASSTTQMFTVKNIGAGPATAVTPAALAAPYSAVSGNCGATLASGATCTVTIAFAPTADGTFSGAAHLSYNDGLAVQTLDRPMTGTATSAARVGIYDSANGDTNLVPFDFGIHGSSSDHTFYLHNDGGRDAMGIVAIAPGAPFAFKDGTFPGTGGNCGATLAVDKACSVVVTFSGALTGASNWGVTYNTGTGQPATVSRDVTGTTTTHALLEIIECKDCGAIDQPTDFGNVGTGQVSQRTFGIRNAGGGIATSLKDGGTLGSGFAFAGNGTFLGSGGTCGDMLPAGAACTVTVTFAPTAIMPYSSTLSVNYKDGGADLVASHGLRGSGADVSLLAIRDFDFGQDVGPNAPPFDFGTWGVPMDHTFFVANHGNSDAMALGDGGGLGNGFAFKGGAYPGQGGNCGNKLSPNAVCSIVVLFTPQGSGVRSSSINLAYTDAGKARTLGRTVTATATTGALLVIVDYDHGGGGGQGPFNFGPSGIAIDHTFTVGNAGAMDATALQAGTTLGGDFSFPGGYPGGGTCGGALAFGKTCTIVVRFSPNAGGQTSSTITIDYSDGVPHSATRAVTGTPITAALLVMKDCDNCGGDQTDFGQAASPVHRSVILQNVGASTATAIKDGGTLTSGFAYTGGNYPGSDGGTCGGSLASGASCTLSVGFSPPTGGLFNATLTLNYNDGTSAASVTRRLSGTGLSGAHVTIRDCDQCGSGGPNQSPFDYGTAGTATDHVFFLQNDGAVDATAMADGGGLGNNFSFKGGAFPGTGGNCGNKLTIGPMCSVVVTFAPTGSGMRASNINISYFDGTATQTASRGVTGTATSGALLIIRDYFDPNNSGGGGGFDPPTYDFGSAGIVVDHTFTVVNSGAKAAGAMAAGTTLTGDFSFAAAGYPGGGNCGATLNPGASCTIVVRFSPSVAGQKSSTISVTYDDGSPHTVTRAVTGTAITGALLRMSDCNECGFGPGQTYFGATGVAVTRQILVRNIGAAQATAIADGGGLASPFAYAAGTFPGTGGDCGAALDSGATCSVNVTFAPITVGQFNGTLTLKYNDGTGVQNSARTLSGSGVDTALVRLRDCDQCGSGGGGNQPPFDYGTAGAPVSHTFTVVNEGSVEATMLADAGGLGNNFAYQGGQFPGTGGTCTARLGIGGNCTVVVTFTPVDNGLRSSSVILGFFDGKQLQKVSRALSGTATSGALLLISDWGPDNNQGNSLPYDFGTYGIATEHIFTVVNKGAAVANSLAAGNTLGGAFSFPAPGYPGGGTCGATLAAGANCSLIVRFTPTGSGPRSSTITITYTDGSAKSASRDVRGTATTGALLQILDWPGNGVANADGPPWNFGTWGVASSHEFTLANDGLAAVTDLADGAALAGSFAYAGSGAFPGGGTCGSTLASGASCTVVVAFTPTGTGVVNGQLKIVYKDGATPMAVTRLVTGTATTRAHLVISDHSAPDTCDGCSWSFGQTTVGQTNDHLFTVYNTGAVTVSVLADGNTLAAPFRYKNVTYPGTGGTCGATLAAGASCSLNVTFAPTGAGSAAATITLLYQDGQQPNQTAARMVNGIGQ